VAEGFGLVNGWLILTSAVLRIDMLAAAFRIYVVRPIAVIPTTCMTIGTAIILLTRYIGIIMPAVVWPTEPVNLPEPQLLWGDTERIPTVFTSVITGCSRARPMVTNLGITPQECAGRRGAATHYGQ